MPHPTRRQLLAALLAWLGFGSAHAKPPASEPPTHEYDIALPHEPARRVTVMVFDAQDRVVSVTQRFDE